MDGDDQNLEQSIAVIGMACRLPGQVDCPSDYWDLIMAARSPQSIQVPQNRFNIDAFHHSHNERPGSFNVPGGYFLEGDPADFDPSFFGITPVEATWMDPQQRKLLEVVYEALESSGTPLHKVSGSLTGCFIGSFTSDFQQMSFKEPDFRHTYSATGVDPGILANRIAHVFNFHGPSAVINTACSSSLTALHMACSAIRNHDCEAAFVGGSNLILTVDQHMNTAKLGVLSPTSQCHTFDESADGYARAEGVGALYLKPLATALRDRDPVRAVIRSTAINSNGRNFGVGISHPSVQGQVNVIRSAYEKAGLDPSKTTYVECHGTGTPAGDPKELQAISQAMIGERQHQPPLLVGSVKPLVLYPDFNEEFLSSCRNIGHSEASSSISTIIKAILAIENATIPPTAGIVNLSTAVRWKDWNIQPVTKPKIFPISSPSRRISVNASGYGGTNAHAIIENLVRSKSPRAYKSSKKSNTIDDIISKPNQPHLLVFSAHDKTTLMQNVRKYAEMKYHPKLLDIAYTLAERRSTFAFRAYTVGRQESIKADLLGALQTIKQIANRPVICFAFTGQGAQWPRMGSRLFEAYPSYTKTIQELDQVLAELPNPPSWTLNGCLSDIESTFNVNDAEIAQPLCTAVQIGLVQLLAQWNIFPVVTVGHSSGEIAAAFTAGYLSAQDAIRIAFYRGKVVASAKATGAMLAVSLDAAEILRYLERYQNQVVVACHNSPNSVTLSGDAAAIDKLKACFDAEKIFARVVRTGGKAYHSSHMVPAALEYRDLLINADLCGIATPQKSRRCRMISTVSNDFVDDEGIDPTYWALNLESPVLFNQAITKLTESMPDLNMIVEIGPHPALSGPIRQIAANTDKALSYIPTLKRGKNDADQLLNLAGELWARDSAIDISTVTSIERFLPNGDVEKMPGSLLVDLPTYQWNYSKKYYSEPRQSREHRECKHPRHDLLGRAFPGLSPGDPQWRNILRLGDIPWLKDHTLGNEVVFPAAGYFAMAIEAITQINKDSEDPSEIHNFTLKDVSIKAALVVPNNDSGVETLFALRRSRNGPAHSARHSSQQWYTFSVSSISVQENAWKEHATGMIGINRGPRNQTPKQNPALPLHASGKSWYRSLSEVGFKYGPTFQNMIKVHMDHKLHAVNCNARVKLESGLMQGESSYTVHPGTVDACLQSIIVSIYGGKLSSVTHGFVPIGIDSITVWTDTIRSHEELSRINTRVYDGNNRHYSANSQMISEEGKLILDLQGVHCVAYEAAVPQSNLANQPAIPYWRLQWMPDLELTPISNTRAVFARFDVLDFVTTLCHNNVSTKILDIDGELAPVLTKNNLQVDITITVPSEKLLQDKKEAFKDYPFVKVVELDAVSELHESSFDATYDLLAVPETADFKLQHLRKYSDRLAPGGFLLLMGQYGESILPNELQSFGLNKIHLQQKDVVLLEKLPAEPMTNGIAPETYHLGSASEGRSILLVTRNDTNQLSNGLLNSQSPNDRNIRSSLLQEVQAQPEDQVIIIEDFYQSIIYDLQDEELKGLQHLAQTTTHIIWVTTGGFLSAQKPEYAMVSGLARCLRAENASLDLVTVDFDIASTTVEQMTETIAMFANRQVGGEKRLEAEYLVDGGVIYTNRLVPIKDMVDSGVPPVDQASFTTLGESSKLEATIKDGKLYFQDQDESVKPLESDQAEVNILAVGTSQAHISEGFGPGYRSISNHEIGGIVTAIGSEVSHLKVGDRVIGFSSDSFSTSQRALAMLLCPIGESDSFEVMLSVQMALSIAIHGLQELAHVEEEETVLILDNTGAAGFAALQVCQAVKARPIVVTEKEDIHASLRDAGLSDDQLILCENGNIADEIWRSTQGLGIDVVFSQNTPDGLLEDCVANLAPFARIILIGEERFSSGGLDELLLSTKASVFRFDMLDICQRKPKIAARLLRKCVQFHKTGKMSHSLPFRVSSISEVDNVVSQGSNSIVERNSVISYENNAIVKTLPSQHSLRFDPDAVYLLIGCLGGLGRSLTSWMVDRGARHLAFLARSGAKRPAAAHLISTIEARGVEVIVLQGDVGDSNDVKTAIQTITQHRQLRGVVNAAMVLNDCLFQSMDPSSWHQTINPKVHGSKNLHEATNSLQLDFFVLLSSTSGILGTPGQSNYAAGNTFQDALAVHRRALGLPAVSLILPMVLGVGYVADNPEVEESLLRKGIYGIHEDELLEGFERAMRPQTEVHLQNKGDGKLPPDDAHIILGFEPGKLAHSVAQPETRDAFWLDDPRFEGIRARMQSSTSTSTSSTSSNGSNSNTISSLLALHKSSPEAAVEVIQSTVFERLARLLNLDPETVTSEGTGNRSLASFGLDSMIGTEFRSWLFREFGLDFSFQRLLGEGMSLGGLARDVVGGLLVGGAEG